MSSVQRLSEKHEHYDLSLSVMQGQAGKVGVNGLLTIFSMIEGKPIITRKVSAIAFDESLDGAEEAVIGKLLERAGV